MIDDNPIEHLIMDRMLERYGYHPETIHCLNAQLALKMLVKNKSNPKELPDLILMDLNMSNISGWDFLERFSKFEPTLSKHVDIHIMTSSIDKTDIDKSKTYPCVKSYIIKPITQSALKTIFD
jgi:CheY-like chemotaxis protein